MSRIGKLPVEVPSGVEVTLSGQDITVKGSLGQLQWSVPTEIGVEKSDNVVSFTPKNEERTTNAKWGLSRAIVANMVLGVSKGFSKDLELRGVGYRAAAQGSRLELNVGYSHPVVMQAPQGVTVMVQNNTEISIKGYDKQTVGQFAADVRGVRPPEPYKGKGIRYKGEAIFMKEGKKK